MREKKSIIRDKYSVVLKINFSPAQTLKFVNFLLLEQHLHVETLLDLLVGIVDTELLKRVVFKDFKAGNVKDANKAGRVAAGKGLVDTRHKEVECSAVDKLGQSVACNLCVRARQRNPFVGKNESDV